MQQGVRGGGQYHSVGVASRRAEARRARRPRAACSAPARARAATNLGFMHESSFIPTYDDFVKKTLVPEYQKATGIAVDYQLVSVGSLQTRMATAAETGNGPDMTLHLLQLAVPVRREAGRCQRHRRDDRQEERRLVRLRQGGGGRQRQVEGDPVRQRRPDHELAHRLVRRGRRQGLPRYLGRAAGSRHQAEEGRTIRSASNWAMGSATTMAGCIRCCGRTARARSSRTARPS